MINEPRNPVTPVTNTLTCLVKSKPLNDGYEDTNSASANCLASSEYEISFLVSAPSELPLPSASWKSSPLTNLEISAANPSTVGWLKIAPNGTSMFNFFLNSKIILVPRIE